MTIGDCSNWWSGTGVGSIHSSVHSKWGIETGYFETLRRRGVGGGGVGGQGNGKMSVVAAEHNSEQEDRRRRGTE
jgi:hypothetical protein